MAVARAEDPSVDEAMAAGRWGLDRASLLIRLAKAGASPELVSEAAANYSLGRLYGLVLSLREVSSLAEQADFDSRFLVIQPNLDESVFRLWGSLHGVDGQTVDKALRRRAAGFGAAGFGAAGFGKPSRSDPGSVAGRRLDRHRHRLPDRELRTGRVGTGGGDSRGVRRLRPGRPQPW